MGVRLIEIYRINGRTETSGDAGYFSVYFFIGQQIAIIPVLIILSYDHVLKNNFYPEKFSQNIYLFV